MINKNGIVLLSVMQEKAVGEATEPLLAAVISEMGGQKTALAERLRENANDLSLKREEYQ